VKKNLVIAVVLSLVMLVTLAIPAQARKIKEVTYSEYTYYNFDDTTQGIFIYDICWKTPHSVRLHVEFQGEEEGDVIGMVSADFFNWKDNKYPQNIQIGNGIPYTMTPFFSFGETVTVTLFITDSQDNVVGVSAPFDIIWGTSSSIPVDDNYEENDTWETAYNFIEYTWLSNIDGSGIQADDDWYQIELSAPTILVDCQFTHSEGDINIALCDSSGSPLASSESINDNEYIEYNTGSSFGTYYIRVYGANAGNTYDLWWDDVAGIPVDDNYEENDTWGTAYYPGYDWENIWLSSIAGYGIQGDEDWYQIYVDDTIVQVDCQFTHSEGDINIALCDSSGSPLAYSDSETDNEYIEYTVPSLLDTYYIRVYGANAGNTYDLWWDDVA